MRPLIHRFILLTASVCLPVVATAEIHVTDLRCEGLVQPLGIDEPQPLLSWVLESPERSQRQSAYRVFVASTPAILAASQGDLWDSGRVESDRSIGVTYSGKRLASRLHCYWKVRVWDRDGRGSDDSAPAEFELGLLEPSSWQAHWISAPAPGGARGAAPCPLLRRRFVVSRSVDGARVYVSGLGYYELYLNGQKVGDHVLDPAFTRYDRRVLYVTYDVTAMIQPGENVIGAVLGNGWYNVQARDAWGFEKSPWRAQPTLLCQLELRRADGTTETIATDASWKVSTGPILMDGIRSGETYDARRERHGWNAAGFDEHGWEMARVVDGPKGRLRAQMMPPIKVMRTLVPKQVSEPKPGIYVFDLGQNIPGWARLHVTGPAGTRIILRYGERLDRAGTVDQKEIGKFVKEGPFQTDTYILKGGGEEVWEPRFTYHGFQFVELRGFPGRPGPGAVEGRVVHTSFDSIGQFDCSNELLDRIHRATQWSYVGNFHGYPTDCPHREKNGWTGDAHLAAEVGLYNEDVATCYRKWLNDFADEQRPSGELPSIIPNPGWGYTWGNGPAWDSALILIPWYVYLYTGDSRILERHFAAMKLYVDYLTGKASDGIVGIGLGDWSPARSTTPESLTSTGYYAYDARRVSEIASILGRKRDAKRYAALADKIRAAFNREFFDPSTGSYANGTQTASSCALQFGLVPGPHEERVFANLVANIERQGGHLDAGILGTKFLIDCLTERGRADLVYTMATQTDYPSWGRWLEQGGTTLWEKWSDFGSHNHIMFGHIDAWFYSALAGIRPDPAAPGFRHFVVEPEVVGDLTFAGARHRSPFGWIESRWTKLEPGSHLVLEVTVPVNTTATVNVPARRGDVVLEGDHPAEASPGVELLERTASRAAFAVGSGRYRFVVEE